MYTVLLILLILNCLVLVGSVLLQAGKGGGLAANFGGAGSSDSFMGSRQASTVMTRTSWWAGGVFLALSFMLSLASTRAGTPDSVLGGAFGSPAAQTAPASGADLSQMLNKSAADSGASKAGGTSDTSKSTPPPGQ